MTVKELYDWAVKQGCENCEIVMDWDGDGRPYVLSILYGDKEAGVVYMDT